MYYTTTKKRFLIAIYSDFTFLFHNYVTFFENHFFKNLDSQTHTEYVCEEKKLKKGQYKVAYLSLEIFLSPSRHFQIIHAQHAESLSSGKNSIPQPGVEPRSPSWEAETLPLSYLGLLMNEVYYGV